MPNNIATPDNITSTPPLTPVLPPSPARPPLLNLLPILAALLILVGAGYLIFNSLTHQPATPIEQVAPELSVKPLQSLVGTIDAVDTEKSVITIHSQGQSLSYPVSNDVIISQIVLGIPSEEGKQVSLPTDVLYLEDLKKKNGSEVYLVFDQNVQTVVQIQIYQKDKK